MAGTTVEMSPVGMFMIHNPSTVAIGDTAEMKAAIRQLDEVKESILNAYELKSNLPRAKISAMMDAESWMNAKKALEFGFVDKILFAKENEEEKTEGMLFSRAAVTNSFLEKIKEKSDALILPHKELGNRVSAETLMSRFNLISH